MIPDYWGIASELNKSKFKFSQNFQWNWKEKSIDSRNIVSEENISVTTKLKKVFGISISNIKSCHWNTRINFNFSHFVKEPVLMNVKVKTILSKYNNTIQISKSFCLQLNQNQIWTCESEVPFPVDLNKAAGFICWVGWVPRRYQGNIEMWLLFFWQTQIFIINQY